MNPNKYLPNRKIKPKKKNMLHKTNDLLLDNEEPLHIHKCQWVTDNDSTVYTARPSTSVLQQRHLSLLLSHFKAQSIFSCFLFLVKVEWEEIFTECLQKALLILYCSSPDNPITSRNDKAFSPKHDTNPPHTTSPDNSFPAGSTQPLFIFYTSPPVSLLLGTQQSLHLTHYAR